jgi:hypothetical protein
MITLSDLDRDGDLDWTVGTCWPKPLEKRSMYWYEYCGPSHWVRHEMGQDADQYGGACSVDLNGDGYHCRDERLRIGLCLAHRCQNYRPTHRADFSTSLVLAIPASGPKLDCDPTKLQRVETIANSD